MQGLAEELWDLLQGFLASAKLIPLEVVVAVVVILVDVAIATCFLFP